MKWGLKDELRTCGYKVHGWITLGQLVSTTQLFLSPVSAERKVVIENLHAQLMKLKLFVICCHVHLPPPFPHPPQFKVI